MRVRQERYATQAQALAEMRRLAGLAISESEYAQWEAGSRVPREDNPKVQRLYEFFGSRPESVPEASVEPGQADLTGLVVALTTALQAQTQALSDIRLELRAAALDAAQERAATADVLARLEAELTVLRERVGSGAGTAGLHPGRN